MPNGHYFGDYTSEPDYEDSIQLVRVSVVNGQVIGAGIKAFEKIYSHWKSYYLNHAEEAIEGSSLRKLESAKKEIHHLGGVVSEDMEKEISEKKHELNKKNEMFRSKLLEVILSDDWQKVNPRTSGDGFDYKKAHKLFGIE